MAIVNKEITVRDLLDEIEREAKVLIETLGLTREEAEANEEVKLHIRGMELIVAAWKLEDEEIRKVVKLHIKDEEFQPFDGKVGMEIQWGLFRTAVKLCTEEERMEIFKLAKFSSDFYALEAYVD